MKVTPNQPETKLSCPDFGRALVVTQDLDPVYVVLHHAALRPEVLRRWLLAYWCFYHAGTASWITAGRHQYWFRMREAAGFKDYPRSAERRHYRGEQALKSVRWLQEQGVERLFDELGRFTAAPSVSADDVMEYVQEWVGFGSWISFKVADMLERLGLLRVHFTVRTAMYDAPTQGAYLYHEHEGRPEVGEEGHGGVVAWAVTSVLGKLHDLNAPPRHERPLNVQEVETIFCKWKSYMNGRYHLGEDVAALRQALLRFARERTSQSLLRAGIKGGLWGG